MSDLGVLDRQVVETELVLDLMEELVGGIVQADPYEDAGLLESFADVRDGDVTYAPAV
jgi:hypothetical protein